LITVTLIRESVFSLSQSHPALQLTGSYDITTGEPNLALWVSANEFAGKYKLQENSVTIETSGRVRNVIYD